LMAKKEEKPKGYTMVITDPDGKEMIRKFAPAKIIDQANFTKVHKVKALLNIFSK